MLKNWMNGVSKGSTLTKILHSANKQDCLKRRKFCNNIAQQMKLKLHKTRNGLIHLFLKMLKIHVVY